MPALQLASRMLTSPPVWEFLSRIKYSYEEDLDDKFKKIVLYRELLPHLEKSVLEDLLKLSTKLSLECDTRSSRSGEIKVVEWNTTVAFDQVQYAVHGCSNYNKDAFHAKIVSRSFTIATSSGSKR